MTKTALAVFSKTPESKQAKTRLRVGSINNAQVQDLHRGFVKKILEQVSGVADCERFVFWLPGNESADLNQLQHRYPYAQHHLQEGDSFSARFSAMVETLRSAGFSKLIIVGSDCPELASEHLTTAKDLLDAGHSVYGPAQRGGMYLLGFSSAQADVDWHKLFAKKNQHQAFEKLFAAAVALPPLRDMDFIEDLEHLPPA